MQCTPAMSCKPVRTCSSPRSTVVLSGGRSGDDEADYTLLMTCLSWEGRMDFSAPKQVA